MDKPMSIIEATTKLNEALCLVREAAENHVRQYGENDPRGLLQLIDSHRAMWSGGPNSSINIVETAIRDKAMQALAAYVSRHS